MPRTGRPATFIDLDQIRQLAGIQCTYEEMGAVLGIGKRGFIKRVTANKKLREAIEDGWANGRASVRRQQYKMLMEGNATMGVWLGKQILGQRDKLDAQVQVIRSVKDIPDEVLDQLINEAEREAAKSHSELPIQ